MSNPVFALSRENYYHERSYADYLRLIQLSGYETCFFDEMDIHDPTRCYILSPYDPAWGGFPGARARLIWYDLEWHIPDFPHIPGIAEVWAADQWYAAQIGARYVPLGSHVGLAQEYEITENGASYDYALLAYMTNRRAALVLGCTVDDEAVTGLRDLGLSITPNGWGQARHNALRATRLMLHVHQHDHVQTCAPQRFALAAAYELPLLTETLQERGIFGPSYVLVSDYKHLPRMAKQWLGCLRILADYGLALHNLLCRDKTFKVNVEAAL